MILIEDYQANTYIYAWYDYIDHIDHNIDRITDEAESIIILLPYYDGLYVHNFQWLQLLFHLLDNKDKLDILSLVVREKSVRIPYLDSIIGVPKSMIDKINIIKTDVYSPFLYRSKEYILDMVLKFTPKDIVLDNPYKRVFDHKNQDNFFGVVLIDEPGELYAEIHIERENDHGRVVHDIDFGDGRVTGRQTEYSGDTNPYGWRIFK